MDQRLLDFADIFVVYGKRFDQAPAILEGTFAFRGASHTFGSLECVRWDNTFGRGKKLEPWQHDLCFMTFGIALCADCPDQAYSALSRIISACRSRDRPRLLRKPNFAWTPIALSLRILSLTTCVAMARRLGKDDAFEDVACHHIWECYQALRYTKEDYLGYNHAVFGRAAMAVAECLFELDSEESISVLTASLERGLLDDGYWAERSATYHVHMLAVVRAIRSLRPAGDMAERLRRIDREMADALATMLHPDGDIALFNDAALGDAPHPMLLGIRPAVSQTPDVTTLPEAGFVRLSNGSDVVIFDVGPMGPDDVIGHAHADFLSFECSINGERFIVDPGVASITNDQERTWTRSSAYHNGPSITGQEPAEPFGAWRVGRRGAANLENAGVQNGAALASAVCDGYLEHTGILVRRAIRLAPERVITVSDTWLPSDSARGQSPITTLCIDEAWTLQEEHSQGLRFTHRTGIVAVLRVTRGHVSDARTGPYFPSGPADPRVGTWIRLAPDDGKLCVAATVERSEQAQ
jgi:hypothetical protein